jgi:branched-subunit amino acid aminotransferase/4-amino-4-deoxychorismate lyase
MSVFLQGSFVQQSQALVSAFDAGLQHAVGLFETMTAVVEPPLNAEVEAHPAQSEEAVASRTRVVHLSAHTRRLLTSCAELGLTQQLRATPLEEAIIRTVARTHQERCAAAAALAISPQRYRLRCTITGGSLNLLQQSKQPVQEPSIIIAAQPATQYPDAMFASGVPITLSNLRVSPLDPTTSHKTLNYWARLRELQLASARGASEALVLDVTNHLVGGCVSSIVLVKNGSLHLPAARGEGEHEEATSPNTDALALAGISQPAQQSSRPALTPDGLPSCVLPGTTREWVLAWADEELIDIHLRPLTVQDLLEADEVLLTNSSWGVLPVIALESTLIGKHTKHAGKPGPIAQTLRKLWLAL